MKPIDQIKQKIDTDLLKYHHSNLCLITDINDLKSSGIMAMVVPLSDYEDSDGEEHKNQLRSYNGILERFPVVILNRMSGENEELVKEKYYALVFNAVKDRTSLSPAFLIPKMLVDLSQDWIKKKSSQISNVESRTRSLVSPGDKL